MKLFVESIQIQNFSIVLDASLGMTALLKMSGQSTYLHRHWNDSIWVTFYAYMVVPVCNEFASTASAAYIFCESLTVTLVDIYLL